MHRGRPKQTSLDDAILARAIRDGGVKMVLISRYGVIPPTGACARSRQCPAEPARSADRGVRGVRDPLGRVRALDTRRAAEGVHERLPWVRLRAAGRRPFVSSLPSPRLFPADAYADASAAITAINYSIIGVVSSAALPVLLYMRARQIAVTPDVVYERRRGRAGRYAAALDQGAGGPEAGGSAKTAGDLSST
jgi:hypothetical protein